MQKHLPYPQRPIRAAWILFLCLSAWCTIFMPFAPEVFPPSRWVFAYAYCAILAIVVIGLIRIEIWIIILLVVMTVLAFVPAVVSISFIIMTEGSPIDSLNWIGTSVSLFYVVGLVEIYFTAKGWGHYFRQPQQKTSDVNSKG